MKRDVAAQLDVEITAPTTLEFQIAVAPHPNTEVRESLSFVLDGSEVQPLESPAPTAADPQARRAGRHPQRRLRRLDHRPHRPGAGHRIRPIDVSAARPLRRGGQVLRFRRNHLAPRLRDLLENVSSWVGTQLNYVPGSSDPIDGAVDTLLAGAGCAGTSPIWWSRYYGRSTCRRGWCRCTRRAVPDGLPRSRRGVRRRAVAGGGRDAAGAAPEPGAHRRRRDATDTAFLDSHKARSRWNASISPPSWTATCPGTRSTTWCRSAELSQPPRQV